VLQLLVTTNDVPSSLILFILLLEAIRSSETSVLIRVVRRYIPEDSTFHMKYNVPDTGSLTLALSKGPNSVGVSLLHLKRKQNQFPKPSFLVTRI
jgi:hypothetical protein